MKLCRTCGETKELSSFHKDKRNKKDGLQSKCKSCKVTYQKDNKESIAKYKANYRIENREQCLETSRLYKLNNPIRTKASAGLAYARKHGSSASDTYSVELCMPFYELATRLTEETGIPHEVDHIIPVSKGGLHCQTNLQVLTKAENKAKADKLPEELKLNN